jgi:hypothetical protein
MIAGGAGRTGARRPTTTAAAALLGAALALAAAETRAQTVRYGVMGESVRARLDSAWSDDPRQVERAYCVRRARISEVRVAPGALDSIIRVLDVRPAAVREAGPNHAVFECAPGTPELHTHPPATCPTEDTRWCVAGGPDAYSCQPSRGDYEKLLRRRDPYGVIQCGASTFRFFYPSEFGPAPAAAQADLVRSASPPPGSSPP